MSERTRQETPTPRPRDFDVPDDPDPARRLWSLWRQGQQPRVADFLERAGVRDPEEIVMALRVDQAERCRLGQWVPAEDYIDAFPAIRDHAASAIDLIFAEYLLREGHGERPPPEEFLRRFPQHAEELKLQIELHRELDDDRAPAASLAGTVATLPVDGDTAPAGAARGPSADPRLRDPERPGPGRHGDRLSRPAGRVEAPRGPEDAHRRLVGQPGGRGAVPGRGRGHGADPAPEHRPDPRRRPECRAPFLVLELVEGRSLAQVLAGTPQPAEWSARTIETLRGPSTRRTRRASCTATCRRPTS